MPLYEYRCELCNKVYEVIQKFSDEPLKTCETCAGPVEKLMSRTSFQLKGSGWYATDYKKSTAPVAPSPGPTPSKGETTPPATLASTTSTPPGTTAKAESSPVSQKSDKKT